MFENKYEYENIILDEDVVDKTKNKKEGKLILTDFRLVFCEKKGMFGGRKLEISKELVLPEIKTVEVEWGKNLGTLKVNDNKKTHIFVIADPIWDKEISRMTNISSEKYTTPKEIDLDLFTETIQMIQPLKHGCSGKINLDGVKVELITNKLCVYGNVTIPINKIRDIRFDKLIKGNTATDVLCVVQSKWICIDYVGQNGMKTIGLLGKNAEKSNVIIAKLFEVWNPSQTPQLIHKQAAEKINNKVKGIGGSVVGKIKRKTCPQCGTQKGRKEKFCQNCGVSFEDEKPNIVKCTECGNDLLNGAKFCGKCGTDVEMSSNCSNCGIEIEPESKFCAECGTQV